ncbi:MAG: Asparaginase [Bacteroidetes bacterium]|nr:Asparaginase [Bacteroidota bacterium]
MISLIVHGGAWDIPDSLVEPHRKGVAEALRVGWEILTSGGPAAEAIEAAIMAMEDDETFDAGRGSFINAVGEVELDASIMDGRNLRAGSVAAVQNVKNPIRLARKIMDVGEQVMLVGIGATRFAKQHKIPTCSPDSLVTARELERWKDIQASDKFSTIDAFQHGKLPSDTVGAVAMDKHGNLASGTSTGGTPNKHPGRVGDSPIIGSGTYADNKFGAVSCTGWGESIMRVVLAKSVVDQIEINGGDVDKAVRHGLYLLETRVKGYGGLIAISRDGRVSTVHNTPRMARGYITAEMQRPVVEV